MSFQLSPGVNVSEIDLTTIIPSVATTVGGFVGVFPWGPVESVMMISDEINLVNSVFYPDSNSAPYFFTAANFLAYASDLRLVRAANNTVKNATSNGVSILIKNKDYYEATFTGANTNGQWAARYPGALGNSIAVYVADSNTYTTGWSTSGATGDLGTLFTAAPRTSDYANTSGSSNDEMHIVVVDSGSKFTGTANTVLEVFPFVSKASDCQNADGTSNYYKDVLNKKSKYVYWMSHEPTGTNWGNVAATPTAFTLLTANKTYQMSGGLDAVATTGDIERAYDLLANPDSIDVSLLMAGPATDTALVNYITNIAATRKDCIACVSPLQANVVNNIGSEATAVTGWRANNLTSTSYAVMDSGWKYQYDKYNDVYRWVPLNGDIAGLIVRTDLDRDPWFSPAGFNRGQLKNVVKLAWNPKQNERDTLYKSGINPVVQFPGEGTVLYGDKTMLTKPSAFDRINVRRLFIVLEKAIARAAKYSLFEFNDEFTRAQFVSMVEPYLRDIKGRRGIYDFRVVCDTTNNTPEVIDSNRFIGDIYIKPARSINFIQLNFVAVRTGVSFDEVVGKF